MHKPYRGINTLCLWAAAQAKGYERGEWATYQQWQDRSAQVRKGEKTTLVVFWKFGHDSAESQDDGSETPARRSRLLFTRGYSVFNAAQVAGYTPKVDADAIMPERIAHAEEFFHAIRADLRHAGNQAFYSPTSDHIQMPHRRVRGKRPVLFHARARAYPLDGRPVPMRSPARQALRR